MGTRCSSALRRKKCNEKESFCDKKKEIASKFGRSGTDTGSPEVQIALLSANIRIGIFVAAASNIPELI